MTKPDAMATPSTESADLRSADDAGAGRPETEPAGAPVSSGAWIKSDSPAEEISPDLANDLINRLFAVSLTLASTVHLSEGSSAADRIGEAVDQLDGIIRAVRGAIFERHLRAATSRHSSAGGGAIGVKGVVEQLGIWAHHITDNADSTAPNGSGARYLLDAAQSIDRARIALVSTSLPKKAIGAPPNTYGEAL
jgi:hypothetical protein